MKEIRCYYCHELIEGEPTIHKVEGKSRSYNRKFHSQCVDKFLNKQKNKEHENKEQEEFDKVYYYMKREVFGIMDSKALNSHLVTRLMGLRQGKHKPSGGYKNTKYTYEWEIILSTVKLCKQKIQYALKTVYFTDDKHQANYIMKILDDNVGKIYMGYIKKKEAEQKADTIVIEDLSNVGHTYKTTETKKNELFDDLW